MRRGRDAFSSIISQRRTRSVEELTVQPAQGCPLLQDLWALDLQM